MRTLAVFTVVFLAAIGGCNPDGDAQAIRNWADNIDEIFDGFRGRTFPPIRVVEHPPSDVTLREVSRVGWEAGEEANKSGRQLSANSTLSIEEVEDFYCPLYSYYVKFGAEVPGEEALVLWMAEQVAGKLFPTSTQAQVDEMFEQFEEAIYEAKFPVENDGEEEEDVADVASATVCSLA